MPTDTPQELMTDGHYPFGNFGTPEQRRDDAALDAAWHVALVAQHVRQYMTVKGVKQSAIARRAGVSQAAVSELVTGTAWSRIDTVARVLRATDGTWEIQRRRTS